MGLFSSDPGGITFKDQWVFRPFLAPVADILAYDTAGSGRASSTTEFFTEMARRGLQDQTNWTANTYKTLLNVASGKGIVAAIIGCTAGGAETTTFEITVDGVLDEIAVGTLASGERACLLTALRGNADYTTVAEFVLPGAEALEADKATWAPRATQYIPPWRSMYDVPCLRFNQSLLIRAKHSTDITNSTATAYSTVMYRLGL